MKNDIAERADRVRDLPMHPEVFNFLTDLWRSFSPISPGYEIVAVNPERLPALRAIKSERDYQDDRWGNTASSNRPGNGERTLDEFALYIAGHSDKLKNFCCEFADPDTKLHEIRKIAALCVWAMEQHGARNNTLLEKKK